VTEIGLREERLVHEATIPVLGVPVRMRSNRPRVIDSFERAYGYWRVLEGHPELCAREVVEGRIVVEADAGAEARAPRAPVKHRVLGRGRMLVSSPDCLGASDAQRRELTAWVTPALLDEPDHFRYHVLEALVLSVVTWMDRMPVHASAVVRGSTALLLAGPSGRGKSTLTCAAPGAGLRVLADDMVFVQLEPLRVWGMPTFLHLPADSRRFFPELADVGVSLASSGKSKLALDLGARAMAAPFPVAERLGICVLERSSAASPGWRRLDAGALGAAMGRLDAGFDLFADGYPRLLGALATRGGFALDVGSDPHAAARTLHELIDVVEAA
jgi:hypothetical protein